MTVARIPLSLLDLAPVAQGQEVAAAFAHMGQLAELADALGYHRYWLAEHHNMPGVASAATSVLIGHLAGLTRRIRVGAGGIMLPNHSPLQVAEQFGTLASLYPGRIDLGLGRAPGTDHATVRALRRYQDQADRFPHDVQELLHYLEPVQPGQSVQAVPGGGIGDGLPVWLLGSSTFGARLAAQLGLPYAFASHFAPDQLEAALALYRSQFRPSARLASPYVIVAMNVVAADTSAQARYLFSSLQQLFVNLQRGAAGKVPAPVDDIDQVWLPHERAGVERALAISAVGDCGQVASAMAAVVQQLQPDELMITANIHDPDARLRSFELAMQAWRSLS